MSKLTSPELLARERRMHRLVALAALLLPATAGATPSFDPFVGADLTLRRPFLVPIGSGTDALALRPSLNAGGQLGLRTSEYRLDLGFDGRVYDYIGVTGSPLRGGGGADLGLRVGSGTSLKPVLRARVEYGLEDRIEQAPLTLPHLDAGGSFGVLRDDGALTGSLLFDVDGERWKGSYSGLVIGGRAQMGYRYLPRTDAPALRVSLHRNLSLSATSLLAQAGATGKLGRRTDIDAWVGYGRLSEGGANIPLTVPVFGELQLTWRPRNATWFVAYGERDLDTRAYSAGEVRNAGGLAAGLQGAGLQAKVGGDAILRSYIGSGLGRTDTILRSSGELAYAPGAANHLWVVGDAYLLGRQSSDDSVSGFGWGVGLGVEYWPGGTRESARHGMR
ncbi:MAG: hypothetical protein H6741_25340 [Alphaproteobacteria bacterium]|nr:hypothetical protein [Alphaproteobacteria bacterium]